MKDIINFIASFTQYAAGSQSEAEGIAVILFLSLCLGLILATAGGIVWLIQKTVTIADNRTIKNKQKFA